MFKRIVVIDETLLDENALQELYKQGEEVIVYHDFPDDEEIIKKRIGDADCLLVSYRTRIDKTILDACPSLRYIGMCCTIYEPQCCNVDLQEAFKKGVMVTGIKDYGDEGVVEYVVSELIRLLHGFGGQRWQEESLELTKQRIGIVGLGKTGRMIADALHFFGASVFYYCRTAKTNISEYAYMPLHELLKKCDIICTCLPRNTILLGKDEFNIMGNRKILINTSVGATFDIEALKIWLNKSPQNFYLCDAVGMGNMMTVLSNHKQVIYTPYIAGLARQSVERLGQKVLQNMQKYTMDFSGK